MVKNVPNTAGPHITLLYSTLLCYNVADMPQKLNPCFYRLDYGLFHYRMEICFIIQCFTESPKTYL